MNGIKITISTVGAILLSACASQTTATAPVAPVAKAPLVAATAPAPAPEEPQVDEHAEQQWQQFLSARNDYLASLAEPLLACAARDAHEDTAVMSACTSRDWPSMMRSAYALTQLAKLTGNASYADAAATAVDKKVLRAVKHTLDHDGAANDPYAYTWLLATAATMDSPSPELVALADRVAGELEQWLGGMAEHEMVRGVMLGAPNSVAWVAQNLWQWGDASGDADLAQRMEKFTETRLATDDYDEWCSLAVDQRPETYELFPPCLHRVLAVLTVMPQDKSGKWLDRFLDEEVAIEPLDATWSTHAALNFSRSWGLWALYNATGDTTWRDLYVKHVMTQMDPAAWTSLDDVDRPWIAQFGVLAIGLSYAPNKADPTPGGTAAAPQ